MDILMIDNSDYVQAAQSFGGGLGRVTMLSSLEDSLYNCNGGKIIDGKFDFTIIPLFLGLHYEMVSTDACEIIRNKRLRGTDVFNDLNLHRVYVFSQLDRINGLIADIFSYNNELDDLGDEDVDVRDDLGFFAAAKEIGFTLESTSKKEFIVEELSDKRDNLRSACAYVRYLREQEQQGNYRFLIRNIH